MTNSWRGWQAIITFFDTWDSTYSIICWIGLCSLSFIVRSITIKRHFATKTSTYSTQLTANTARAELAVFLQTPNERCLLSVTHKHIDSGAAISGALLKMIAISILLGSNRNYWQCEQAEIFYRFYCFHVDN